MNTPYEKQDIKEFYHVGIIICYCLCNPKNGFYFLTQRSDSEKIKAEIEAIEAKMAEMYNPEVLLVYHYAEDVLIFSKQTAIS